MYNRSDFFQENTQKITDKESVVELMKDRVIHLLRDHIERIRVNHFCGLRFHSMLSVFRESSDNWLDVIDAFIGECHQDPQVSQQITSSDFLIIIISQMIDVHDDLMTICAPQLLLESLEGAMNLFHDYKIEDKNLYIQVKFTMAKISGRSSQQEEQRIFRELFRYVDQYCRSAHYFQTAMSIFDGWMQSLYRCGSYGVINQIIKSFIDSHKQKMSLDIHVSLLKVHALSSAHLEKHDQAFSLLAEMNNCINDCENRSDNNFVFDALREIIRVCKHDGQNEQALEYFQKASIHLQMTDVVLRNLEQDIAGNSTLQLSCH